jgi:tRNA(fMet)-specific endonuclease VapC
MKYLLDTNICVHFLNRNPVVFEKLQQVSDEDIGVSIISIAELKFGAYNSKKIKNNLEKIKSFTNIVQTIRINDDVADKFGETKTYLRSHGFIFDDFDILIGATAIVNNLILVTNNIKHFINISEIILEDWTKK